MNIIQDRALNKYKDRINAILKPLSVGRRAGNLNPEAISKKKIEKIIENHNLLNKSIYVENIHYVYATAKLTIANMIERNDSTSVHLVISIPVINKDKLHT